MYSPSNEGAISLCLDDAPARQKYAAANDADTGQFTAYVMVAGEDTTIAKTYGDTQEEADARADLIAAALNAFDVTKGGRP